MKRVELKLYHKDKHGSLRCLVGNCEDHLDLLSNPRLCKMELKNAGIEVSGSPVFGIIQGNIVDEALEDKPEVVYE